MPLPRGLRRRCEGILADLDLPVPFTVEGFRDSLERRRGRPIVMEPLPPFGPDAPCGLWIALPSVDVVLYEQRTTPAHQDLIKLHELGHVVCGHTGAVELQHLTGLMPDLTPELIATAMGVGRTSYTTREEQEAEMIALLLSDLVGADRSGPDRAGTAASRRLADSLLPPIRSLRRRRRG
ncbi:ImmA/IrrE family metallo-endopeptidase [Kitasatospora putterlickiae]|uniref:ImmA/IrrE family metallo-endopeptidase n=1 Tax=Kitasatospora putterlickiae TaxID=221725 RepID=A0ABN1YG00_9ACTN